MKTLGIAAHSAEGASLCFTTACREGAKILGSHMHPTIVLSAIPMGLSMPSWESGDHKTIAKLLTKGIKQLTAAGANFFVCPDNTAHIVLEKIIDDLPLPGLHIAEVVCKEIVSNNWKNVGLLGTKWTMTGPVYKKLLEKNTLRRLIPDESIRHKINTAIFDELCNGIFANETAELFIQAIEELQQKGAECVILGCTEISLIIGSTNSPLPVLDSTRLLAKYAIQEAISDKQVGKKSGWLEVRG